MIEFLKQNYRLIIEVVLLITSVIIMCIKKKPVEVVDSAKETVLKLLPGLINDVEINTQLKGSDKKKKVLENLKDLLNLFGYSTACIDLLLAFASEQVEVILSTPQKKGDFHGKR